MAAASKFGAIPMIDKETDRNKRRNMMAIPTITAPKVEIWDVYRLCSMLVYRTSVPVTVKSSSVSYS
jgi:hypothetical protein